MKKYIIILIYVLLSPRVFPQAGEQWVARYTGTGSVNDYANAITIDNYGNIYVTGSVYSITTFTDYATIKYNSSGVQQWVAIYNGAANGSDAGVAIALDLSGNVFVTGISSGGSNDDIVTVKYNPAGVQQWASVYNGPGNSSDYAAGIGIDGSGNIYVTGRSIGSGTGSDGVVIKYNTAGVQQWASRYTSTGNNFDASYCIRVDGAGNSFIGGSTTPGTTGADCLTIKYNTSGVQQWASTYDGGYFNDENFALAIDNTGNVYTTGYSTGSAGDYDYVTIKYNSSGVQQWLRRYDGPGNGYDQAHSIAVDDSGNVYVTGGSTGSTSGTDYATVKYSPSGTVLWGTRYNGPGNGSDNAVSITLDASGNVYVTGSSGGNTSSSDYATIKYNSFGVQQWIMRYNGPSNSYDDAAGITTGSSGNVYVTGSSTGNSFDYTTIRYVQSPLSGTPAPYSPPNNTQGWGLTVNFVWYKVTDALRYHVQVSTDSLFNTFIVNDSTITDSTRTVTGLINNVVYYWRVSGKNGAGSGPWSVVWRFRVGFVGIVPVSEEIPDKFSLAQNYPNPFNPGTHIRLGIADFGFVILKVFDVLGREVSTLMNKELSPGFYEVNFDGNKLSGGVYFYQLIVNGESSIEYQEIRRMVLIK